MQIAKWPIFFSVILAQTKLDVPTQSKYAYIQPKYQQELNFGTFTGCKELSFDAFGLNTGEPLITGWPSNLPPNVTGMTYAIPNGVVVRLCTFGTGATVPTAVYTISPVRY